MIDIDRLPVISFRPETDFEKLMWCESYIRELKRLAESDRLIIEQQRKTIDKLSAIPASVKQGYYYESLKRDNRIQAVAIHRLRKQVKDLKDKLIQTKIL